jgi:signal transduction histidine kinase
VKKTDNKFELLKKTILSRLTSSVDEAALKALSASLTEFEQQSEIDWAKLEEHLSQAMEENELLRSLAGVKENTLLVKIIEQGEELRSLRQNFTQKRESLDEALRKNDALNLQLEFVKSENAKKDEAIKKNQDRYENDLELLNGKLAAFNEGISKKRDEFDTEKLKMSRELAKLEGKVRAAVEDEIFHNLKAFGLKLKNLNNSIYGSAEYCREKLALIDKSIKTFGLEKKTSRSDKRVNKSRSDILQVSPDLNEIYLKSQEISKIIDTYTGLFEKIKLAPEPVNLKKAWEELNKKFLETLVSKSIRIKLPAEKKYPVFVTDKKLFTEICEELTANALENLPSNSAFEISGTFSDSGIKLSFKDNGVKVSSFDKEKLFTPFFTNKPSRKGLGLARMLRLARFLGGDLVYESDKPENIFVLTLPSLIETND